MHLTRRESENQSCLHLDPVVGGCLRVLREIDAAKFVRNRVEGL